jgi:Xaa-Pro aminopeptidase
VGALEELLRELERRAAAVSKAMRKRGIDYIALTSSPNFRYLTGFSEESYERLMLFLMNSEGERILLAPRLANIPSWVGRHMDISIWSDSDDVSAFVERAARRLRIHGRRGAFEDTMDLKIYLFLKEIISPASTHLASEILRDLRARKSLYEVSVIKKAVNAAENVFEEIYRILAPGLTERFLASQISSVIASMGFDEAFKAIVAFGENTENPHHIPGDKRLAYGDLVLIDLGVSVEGYISDLTRLYHLGPIPEKVRDRFSQLSTCFSEAISMISPGVKASEVDLRVRSCLAEYGLKENILHRTGHGIGIEVHEPPYLSINSSDILEKGNVFTVEPGIYFKDIFGLRVESDIAILDNGDVIILDKISRDIIQI